MNATPPESLVSRHKALPYTPPPHSDAGRMYLGEATTEHRRQRLSFLVQRTQHQQPVKGEHHGLG